MRPDDDEPFDRLKEEGLLPRQIHYTHLDLDHDFACFGCGDESSVTVVHCNTEHAYCRTCARIALEQQELDASYLTQARTGLNADWCATTWPLLTAGLYICDEEDGTFSLVTRACTDDEYDIDLVGRGNAREMLALAEALILGLNALRALRLMYEATC